MADNRFLGTKELDSFPTEGLSAIPESVLGEDICQEQRTTDIETCQAEVNEEHRFFQMRESSLSYDKTLTEEKDSLLQKLRDEKQGEMEETISSGTEQSQINYNKPWRKMIRRRIVDVGDNYEG